MVQSLNFIISSASVPCDYTNEEIPKKHIQGLAYFVLLIKSSRNTASSTSEISKNMLACACRDTIIKRANSRSYAIYCRRSFNNK